MQEPEQVVPLMEAFLEECKESHKHTNGIRATLELVPHRIKGLPFEIGCMSCGRKANYHIKGTEVQEG